MTEQDHSSLHRVSKKDGNERVSGAEITAFQTSEAQREKLQKDDITDSGPLEYSS